MKYYFSCALVLLLSLLLLSCSENKVEVSEQVIAGMRTVAMGFMKDLKGVLINQIKTNGTQEVLVDDKKKFQCDECGYYWESNPV